MILTVTLNAALDKTHLIPDFRPGAVNRPEKTVAVAGGKGLNVARVLHALGVPVLATGLLAGRVGCAIADRLDAEGIAHDFHRLAEGESRICLAVIHPGGVTELNEDGPAVAAHEFARFCTHYRELLPRASAVALSGSLPPGLGAEAYLALLGWAREAGKWVSVDTSGKALPDVLAGEPDFAKPNQQEAESVLGYAISPGTLERAVSDLLALGPRGLALSLGAHGAAVATRDEAVFVQAPEVRVLSPVGSGDSFLAGLMAALARGDGLAEAARLAVACGTANAAVAGAAACTRSAIDHLLPHVRVMPLEAATWGESAPIRR